MIRIHPAVQAQVSMGATVQALDFRTTRAIRTTMVITSKITKVVMANRIIKEISSS